MPALRESDDVATPFLDSLVPRDAQPAALGPRHPAVPAIGLDPTPAIHKRQTVQTITLPVNSIIPTYYDFSGPAPGTVAGIVLGSVLGFFLVVWLLWSLTLIRNNGGGTNIRGEEEIVVRRPRKSHSGRSRRSTRTEVREYSRSPRREQVIVEERRERRGPQPTRTRSIIVEERSRVPGDDVVEVIEEHDDYQSRRGSRRQSGGGYR